MRPLLELGLALCDHATYILPVDQSPYFREMSAVSHGCPGIEIRFVKGAKNAPMRAFLEKIATHPKESVSNQTRYEISL